MCIPFCPYENTVRRPLCETRKGATRCQQFSMLDCWTRLNRKKLLETKKGRKAGLLNKASKIDASLEPKAFFTLRVNSPRFAVEIQDRDKHF